MAIDQNSQIHLVLVVLNKAFDSLPRKAIMERLKGLNTSWNVINSIEKLLECTKVRIRDLTSPFQRPRSVP